MKNLAKSLPKLKEQFITPKQGYLARIGKDVVVKIDRSAILFLNDDGTWYMMDNKKLQGLRKTYLKMGLKI